MTAAPIIGIDLGTTNSLVSHFTEDGAVLIPNALGEVLTPSAVGFDEGGNILVGRAAKDRLVTHPELTTARFKRYMGTNREETIGKKKFRAEELSAFVLQSLKADAEAALGTSVSEAVISVPAYFNDVQRKATIAAAQIAGLKVNRLINEPTAAALAYGLQDRDAENTFLIVDLGGGTFDVSILEMFSGVMEVRASAGDAFLGGEDFTDALMAEFARQLGRKVEELSGKDASRLRALADQAKVHLTTSDHAEVTFADEGEDKPLRISRTDFEELCTPLVSRLRMPIQRAIADAGLKADQIDRILLVGGATHMQVIRSVITRLFKRFPEHEIDPDHVVALGAAVQAGLASRHAALEDMVMTDVAPFTLGYETSIRISEDNYESGHFSPLIERNTVVPVSRVHTIYPLHKGQREILLGVYQGEAPFVKDNIKLGELTVKIPYNKETEEPVDVRFTYDNSGVLEVITKVKATNEEQRLLIEGNPGAMSKDEIEKRFAELSRIKVHPRDEAENAAFMARLSRNYENALGDKRDMLTRIIAEFERALHSQDKRVISDARQELGRHLDQIENDSVF